MVKYENEGGRGRGNFRGGRGGNDRGFDRGGDRGGTRRGPPRGGPRGGPKRGAKVYVIPHKYDGVYIAKGSGADLLCTKNFVPGESVYNEKRISVEGKDGEKIEYRVWNPYRSKIAAAVLGGVKDIYIKPGTKVLYLGAASGTTVSHVSDIVGP